MQGSLRGFWLYGSERGGGLIASEGGGDGKPVIVRFRMVSRPRGSSIGVPGIVGEGGEGLLTGGGGAVRGNGLRDVVGVV